MKILRQFLIILLYSFIGEALNFFLPLPIPASIYGMALLFLSLMIGWIRVQDILEAGRFLIEVMPVMFVPAGVGLMTSWGILKPMLLPVSVIIVVSLITVMAVSGLSSQWIVQHTRKKEEDLSDE
ncbi:MAG: CidA/LrgA family protein [Hespellia sp.]|nr:CidA/LrgA family protein [Hespellia sp.]